MAARVADLLSKKMRLKGDDLTQMLARSGTSLPPKLFRQADILAKAAEMAKNPRLLRQINMEEASRAYDYCLKILKKVSLWERYGPGIQGVALSVMTSLILLATLVIFILYWRGLI